jgi:hypothetical protein
LPHDSARASVGPSRSSRSRCSPTYTHGGAFVDQRRVARRPMAHSCAVPVLDCWSSLACTGCCVLA